MKKMTLVHLELLRGLAALMVVATHMSGHLPILRDSIIRNATNFGTEAVAVFFALSGYVMAYSQHHRAKTRKGFLKNRLKRIYPTYLIALLLSYAIGITINKFVSSWQDIGLNLLFAGSLQQHFARLPTTNLALWSLTYEMGFYALFSLCIVQDKTSKKRLVAWTTCAMIALIISPIKVESIGLSFILSILAFSCSWLIGYYAFSIKLPSFASLSLPLLTLIPAASRLPYESIQSPLKFCVIALLTAPFFKHAYNKADSLKTIHIITFLLLITLVAIFSQAQPTNIFIYTLLPILALTAHYFLDIQSLAQGNIINAISLKLGRWSYPLYVLHMPVIFLASWTDNAVGYLCLPLIIAFLVWIVDYQLQPRLTKFFSS